MESDILDDFAHSQRKSKVAFTVVSFASSIVSFSIVLYFCYLKYLINMGQEEIEAPSVNWLYTITGFGFTGIISIIIAYVRSEKSGVIKSISIVWNTIVLLMFIIAIIAYNLDH